jgi:hypothetical protein
MATTGERVGMQDGLLAGGSLAAKLATIPAQSKAPHPILLGRGRVVR